MSLACPKCHTLTTVAALSTSDECSWCGLLLEGETRVLSSAVPRKMPPVSTRGDASYRGEMGQRKALSAVGDRSGGSIACPRCGGTQFTAKRSNTGKAVGFATLGVGGLIAPKSQVKCVACGLKFKRG